jgi:hypothetical protein
MKTGMSLTQMAETLEKQLNAKKDFTAPSKALVMSNDAKTIRVGTMIEGVVTNHAERQLAAKLEIPVAFYDRLKTAHPDLLAHNVNQLFQREPKKMLVRTLDEGNGPAKVRAFLSDRYRPLDNYDLAQAVIPTLIESGAQVVSTELTETKMYIKALAPNLEREIPLPPGMEWGKGHNSVIRRVMGSVIISGSEVGAGKVNIQPGAWERACTNMMIFREESFAKLHIGKAYGDDETVSQFLSDETRRTSDAAIWLAARDTLKATLDGKIMDVNVQKMLAARGDKIEANLVDVVEVFAQKNRFTDPERKSLLDRIMESGEPTRYGLQWAVTRLAGDDDVVTSYDRATELERLGGEIIELQPSEWRQISTAGLTRKAA